MSIFTLAACPSNKGGNANAIILTHPLQQDTTISREYGCQIRSCKYIKVTAPERGYLKTGGLKEGQHVKAGEVMFKIVPGSSRIALSHAEAEAQVAKAAFENTQRRLKNHEATDRELRLAKAAWDDKLTQVKMAQSDERVSMIKAPFSGHIGRLPLPEGSLVDQGYALTTLTDNSEMWVFFNVPQAKYLEYAAQAQPEQNKQVTLVLANGRIFNQPGRINGLEAKVNAQNGMASLRADFTNPTGLLRNGESGIIRMWQTIKQAVLVPKNATFEKRDHYYVFVVGSDQVVRQREIMISAELEDLFVVSEGVGKDDTIVFAGLDQAKDGAKAERCEFEAPEKAFAHLNFKSE